MQWTTFLKNTGWSNETKKTITHKIIETALYPMMERVVRHMKDLIEFCLYLYELENKKTIFLSLVDKYVLFNDKNADTTKKKNIEIEFQNIPDIENHIKSKQQEFINYYTSFKFQKLYKTIKKKNI